ncbi:MAG: hypothetical protein H6602_10135 [Flavobacteriales bacterium]|nr:hypothetical protein [Flavobacteriales bacterium]
MSDTQRRISIRLDTQTIMKGDLEEVMEYQRSLIHTSGSQEAAGAYLKTEPRPTNEEA